MKYGQACIGFIGIGRLLEAGFIAKTIKVVPQEVEVDSVFCIDAFAIVGPGLTILPDVLESIRAEGFTWRPNAKINMGLGRSWD